MQAHTEIKKEHCPSRTIGNLTTSLVNLGKSDFTAGFFVSGTTTTMQITEANQKIFDQGWSHPSKFCHWHPPFDHNGSFLL